MINVQQIKLLWEVFQMKNVIKKDRTTIMFKEGAFKNGEKYVIEYPSGEKREFKFFCGTKSEGNVRTSSIHLSNNIIPNEFKPTDITDFNSRRRITETYGEQYEEYHKFDNEPRIQISTGMTESISFDALCVENGSVKIYHDGKLMTRDEVLIDSIELYVDNEKIKPGDIFKLTIEDNPVFNDALIMIHNSSWNGISFKFQTRVEYSNGLIVPTLCSGEINLRNRDGSPLTDEQISKVHLTLVHKVADDSPTLDRTNDDVYYPRGFVGGAFNVEYPERKYRTGRLANIRRMNEEEPYEEYDDETNSDF